MIEACDKNIMAEVPGTQIPLRHFCKFAKGHAGHCKAVGTFNGIEFEVEFGN